MKAPKFSIILPSLLSDYPGAATQRVDKLIRAVNSVLNQTFQDFELLIISDGCDLTDYIVKRQFTDKRIKLLRVEHNGLFDNTPRNTGIEAAKGKYIIYIDGDDFWGVDHLKIFNDNLKGEDWIWSNDWSHYGEDWTERICDPEQYAHCGTSNICHARRLGLTWGLAGYGHDYHFIQKLFEFENYRQIPTAQYYVCHIGNCYQL